MRTTACVILFALVSLASAFNHPEIHWKSVTDRRISSYTTMIEPNRRIRHVEDRRGRVSVVVVTLRIRRTLKNQHCPRGLRRLRQWLCIMDRRKHHDLGDGHPL